MEMRKRPELLKDYIVRDLGGGIVNITAPPMRFQQYLVIGGEKAALIDTGFGFASLKKIVEGLTDKPVFVINTHGHPDHAGGNAEFAECFMHPDDAELFSYKCAFETRLGEASHWGIPDADRLLQPTPSMPLPLADGQEFDLGGRVLRVILTPGHTRGSICVYDEQTGSLFTGDNTNDHAVSLAEPCAATVTEYLASLEKIIGVCAAVFYTGHMPGAVEPEKAQRLRECAQRIIGGEKGVFERTPMASGYKLVIDGAAIQYNEEKI